MTDKFEQAYQETIRELATGPGCTVCNAQIFNDTLVTWGKDSYSVKGQREACSKVIREWLHSLDCEHYKFPTIEQTIKLSDVQERNMRRRVHERIRERRHK